VLRQTAQDKEALRSPFESKDQAARPSKARGDFRTSGSTERAVEDARRTDNFVEVNYLISGTVTKRTTMPGLALAAFAVA
jgi:hypothetical protein